ncbi:MAG TPA: DnaA regulatory inactivator Hda [Gammaproteobacteria bacterium]|nr:DnaA regulatory inactivator Hda [Gammaproteobacteria bacterium]
MAQLPLALRLESHAVLETFVEGANAAGLAHAKALASGESGGAVWLCGPRGSGKSHVLQAACRTAGAAGRRAMYLPLGAPDVEPGLLAGLDALDVLALDDVPRAAGSPAWEAELFRALNEFQSRERALLMAGEAAPAAAGFALPDLASRAAGAAVYRLQPLADADLVEALHRHARHRGLWLDAAAARFLQSRLPREMGALVAWIERLDAASLAAQRRLTLPFVREILGRSASAPARQDEEQGELEERGEQHEAD